MRNVGIAVVNVIGVRASKSIVRRIRQGMLLTPNGRVLCVIYQLPKSWDATLSVESVAIGTVLDPAGSRGDEDDWEFFGNLVIRVCKVHPQVRKVSSELGVILFRRSGDKPYVRRKAMSEKQVESARFDTIHPVFTRDVANNVWHLEDGAHVSAVVRRLGGLLAWPDEKIALVEGTTSEVAVTPLSLDADLIGVPMKVDYPWAQPTLDFEIRG